MADPRAQQVLRILDKSGALSREQDQAIRAALDGLVADLEAAREALVIAAPYVTLRSDRGRAASSVVESALGPEVWKRLGLRATVAAGVLARGVLALVAEKGLADTRNQQLTEALTEIAAVENTFQAQSRYTGTTATAFHTCPQIARAALAVSGPEATPEPREPRTSTTWEDDGPVIRLATFSEPRGPEANTEPPELDDCPCPHEPGVACLNCGAAVIEATPEEAHPE